MITKYQANRELGFNLGNRTYTPPNVLYVGLSTSNIDASGSNLNEPSADSGYARVAYNNDDAAFSTPSDGQTTTLKKIQFPEFKVDAGIATDVFISDSDNGGNVLYYDLLQKPRVLQADSTLYFEAGGLDFAIVNKDSVN